MILPKNYTPARHNRKAAGTSEIAESHARYFQQVPNNIRYLVRSRYEWMRPYLEGKGKIVELGAGAGFSRDIFPDNQIILTDVTDFSWINLTVDAHALPFEDASCDVLICSYIIHHLTSPAIFFLEAIRVLKPGGIMLINESHNSLVLKLSLLLARHEGWSYEHNVFDQNAMASNPHDAWDGNNAIGDMLFSDHRRFEDGFSGLKIRYDEFRECFLFLVSGGVTARFPTLQLPNFALRIIERFDQVLVHSCPSILGMVRRLVVEKSFTNVAPGRDAH